MGWRGAGQPPRPRAVAGARAEARQARIRAAPGAPPRHEQDRAAPVRALEGVVERALTRDVRQDHAMHLDKLIDREECCVSLVSQCADECGRGCSSRAGAPVTCKLN